MRVWACVNNSIGKSSTQSLNLSFAIQMIIKGLDQVHDNKIQIYTIENKHCIVSHNLIGSERSKNHILHSLIKQLL